MNPWLAVTAGTDPVRHARSLQRAHERHLRGDGRPDGVRDLVTASWQRSLEAGVDPEAPGPPVRLDGDELNAARQRSPLARVIPNILAILEPAGIDARHIVAIGDADANLLWVAGDPGALEAAREMRFEEGAAWGEASAGTNAVGTAVTLDHAVQIFSAEHLVQAVHEWTCSAAPIHDPSTGELIGVIDLTAPLRTAHPHTLSLAGIAARETETALRVLRLEDRARLRERWETVISGRRGRSVLTDGDGQVIASRGFTDPPARVDALGSDGRSWEREALEGGGAIMWPRRRRPARLPKLALRMLGHGASARLGTSGEERAPRSLEVLAVLAMHPEGMTAEQLALALYGERGRTVTVRAQVHRLRAQLSERVVSAQPYRLVPGLEADWIEVGRLVAQGRPREALAAYPGPLLPSSDAPAINDARSLLEESLRRSILTTADPDLLAAWLTHPSGADDLPAARALVAALPPGDPRRAAATATAAALALKFAA